MKTSDINQDQNKTANISESASNNDSSVNLTESTNQRFSASTTRGDANGPAGSEQDGEIVEEPEIISVDNSDAATVVEDDVSVDAAGGKPTKRSGFFLGALVGILIALILLSAPAYVGYNASITQQTELDNIEATLRSTNRDYQALKVEVAESRLAELQRQLLEMEQQEKTLTKLLARKAELLSQRDVLQAQLKTLTVRTQALSTSANGQISQTTPRNAVDEEPQSATEKVQKYWRDAKQTVTAGWEALIDKLPKNWF